MPKYFKYEDPEMAAHVDKIIGAAIDAEENETIVTDWQKRPEEYAINNKDKPFKPMSNDDIEHRYTLAQGGGKDHFIVAKHREEQGKYMAKYEAMAADRDEAGNFHVSLAQTAKVAQVVKDEKIKEQQSLGFLQRIKAAISFSKEAKEKRAAIKADFKVLNKAIEEGEKL